MACFVIAAAVLGAIAAQRAFAPAPPGLFTDLDASVEWNPRQDRMLLVHGNIAADLYFGRRAAVVNGRLVPVDVSPMLVGSQPMVPLRFIGEVIGARVLWDPATRTVSITTNGPSGAQPSIPSTPAQPRRPAGPMVATPAPWVTFRVNGQTVSVEVPPVVVRGRILVPLPARPITPPSLVFGAAYCLLCAGLLRASRGPYRGVMMLAMVALLFAFVLRLVMLALDPNLFAVRALLPLASADLVPTLLFMSAGTVAFWAGGKAVSLASSGGARDPARQAAAVGPYRPYIIFLGLAMAALVLVIYLTVGIRWTRSPLAFLIHFAPVDIMAFILMYVAIDGWQTFTRRERLAVYAFFVLVFLSGVAIGSRTAPFLPLLAWVSAVAVRGRDPRVSVRWMALGLIAFVFLLPGAMSWITIMRDLARDPAQLEVFEGLSLFQIWLRSDFSPLAVFVLLSDRFQGLDMLTIIMNQPPQEAIRAYMTPITLLKSFLVGLVPDALWRIDAPATGSLFAVGYQGYSSLSAAHHGAWTGFGFFYAYFGPAGGLVGLAVLGAIAAWLLGALARAPVLLSIWTSPVLYSLVFLGIVSGNFDLIAPSLFVELAALSGMIWALMRVDRGRAVTRGFANAQTEHVR